MPDHPAKSQLLALLAVPLLASCSQFPQSPGSSLGKVDFESEIKPLLETNCLQCHNHRISHGHLVLESRALAFRPRPGGPVLVPGDAEASLVYSVIRFPDELENAMPPTRHRLRKNQIRTLRRWIDQGAAWPDGPAGELEAPREEFGYPPVNHPALRGS